MESTLRKFTKRLDHNQNHTYEERLTSLGLIPLEKRRQFMDICSFYRYLNDDLLNAIRKLTLKINERSQQEKLKFIEKYRINNVLSNEYSCRVIRYWNRLPVHIQNQPTINLFKIALNSYLRNKDLGDHN